MSVEYIYFPTGIGYENIATITRRLELVQKIMPNNFILLAPGLYTYHELRHLPKAAQLEVFESGRGVYRITEHVDRQGYLIPESQIRLPSDRKFVAVTRKTAESLDLAALIRYLDG